MKTKKEIRKAIQLRLAGQSESDRSKKSRRIEQLLFGEAAFKKSRCLLIYVSLPEEVSTFGIIHESLVGGKRVVVPRLRGSESESESGLLDLRQIKHVSKDLEKGSFGVLEPRVDRTVEVAVDEIDCVIVPGVAFDASGHRLGRGGGYYDRLLARIPAEVPRIALAFDFQIVDQVPLEPHDVTVGKVLSA